MNDPDASDAIGSVILIVIIIALLFLGGFICYSKGYYKGQVHALTGNVKYELVVNPDSTRTWETIDK